MAFCEKNSLFNQNTMVFGVSHDDPDITDVEKLRYDACISKSKDVKLEGNVEIRTIKGGNYAVFLHMGAYEKLIDTYNSIFGPWLGKNNIELRDVPCFEQYMNSPEETAPENLLTEIYIPVK
jgi:AraC family transcriptional regulator